MKDYRKIIADKIKNGECVALYCYGIYCSHMLCYLDKFYGVKPAVVIDNDVTKKGVAEFDIPIMPFTEAILKYDNLEFFICSNDFKYAIIGDLLEKGVEPEKIINYCPIEKSNSCFYNSNMINMFLENQFSNCICKDGFHKGTAEFMPYLKGGLIRNINESNGSCLYKESCNLVFNQYLRADGKFDRIDFIQNKWNDCVFRCLFCNDSGQRFNSKYDFNKYKDFLTELFNSDKYDESPIFKVVFSEGHFKEKVKTVYNVISGFNVKPFIWDILTGMSTYSEEIAEILRGGVGIIIWSLDAGNKETFKKIKQVDAFDNVIKNAKKYISESVFGAKFICAKYLVVKGINDSEKEFESFLNLIKTLDLENVSLDWNFFKEPDDNDIKFIQDCYSKIISNGMNLQYKNINKAITEALNLNSIMNMGTN